MNTTKSDLFCVLFCDKLHLDKKKS